MSKRTFHYPTGVRHPTGKRPKMQNHPRKRVRSKRSKESRRAYAIRMRYSGNKYNAHKIRDNGHLFDSEAEDMFYHYLLLLHIQFRVHPRYTIIKHQNYKSKITGHEFYIRKHSYTPDFEIDDSKIRKPLEIIDIKGGKASPYANLRFDLLSTLIHLPIVIVKRRRKTFVQKVRGKHGNHTVLFQIDPKIMRKAKLDRK